MSISISSIQYLPISMVDFFWKRERTYLKQIKSLIICFRQHIQKNLIYLTIVFVQDPTTSSEEGGDDNSKSAPPLLTTAAQLHLERGECGAVAAGGPDHRPPTSISPCGVEKISSLWMGRPTNYTGPQVGQHYNQNKTTPSPSIYLCLLKSTFSDILWYDM